MLQKFLNRRSLLHIEAEAVLEEVIAHFTDTFGEEGWFFCTLYDLHDRCGVETILCPGRLSSQHLNNAAAKAPHVGVLPCSLSFDNLWGHPKRRSPDLMLLLARLFLPLVTH